MWRANNLSCGIHYFKTFEMHDNYAFLFTNFTQIWKKVRMILILHRKFTFCLFLCLIFFLKECNNTGMNTVFLPLAIRLLKQ